LYQYKQIYMSVQYISGTTAVKIASSVEAAIQAGRMRSGDDLPPIRVLADQLGVSPATVAAAYRTLRGRGLLTTHGRGGTRIGYARALPLPSARPLAARGIDLSDGNPDPAWLPPLGAALSRLPRTARLYGGPLQHAPLVQFAARQFESDRVPGRAVTVVSGALDGIERVAREYLRPGDRVAVEDPSFPGFLDVLASSGLVAVPVVMDEDGPTVASLTAACRAGARALIVTPRAQNPTGAVLSARRAGELARVLAAWPEVVLIEDDHAGPVAGASYVTLAGRGPTRWAVVRSASKFLGPDLRVAVMAGDAETIARVEGHLSVGIRWVSHLLQRLALDLWRDRSNDRRFQRASAVYARRRAALIDALSNRGITATGASGLNVWIAVREETAMTQALSDRGWLVAAGERFRLQSPPAIRVTVARLAERDAVRFADALADTLQAGRRGGSA
jgi:DNA-binding transcriptional MocR family regulator